MTRMGAVHIHSVYSHDGRDTVADLRDFAVRHQLGFLGLSDHAEDFDAATFARFVADCAAHSGPDVAIIPGLEFRFAGLKGMHLLALGLKRWIEPTTPAEFFALAEGNADLTVAAHPLVPQYAYPQVVLDRVDAVEVWNASYNTRFLPDPRAIALFRALRARRPGVVAIVGLDQHDASNYRQTRVEVPAGADPMLSLRSGDFRNVGRTMSFDPAVRWGWWAGPSLATARTILDGVERVQDRTVRFLRRKRGTKGGSGW